MPRSDPNRRQGAFAERYVAESYDLDHRPNEADWYDCVHPRGTKYEVKSTTETYSGEYSDGATGRFRLWEDQHRSLTAAEGSEGQTAWYAFVLLDTDGEVVDVVRRKPSTVTEIVAGNWNQAGHAERNGRQRKLPWPEVME
jgi:hypothetical protein